MFHQNSPYPVERKKSKIGEAMAFSVDLLKGLYVPQPCFVRPPALRFARYERDLKGDKVHENGSACVDR
jgi:hypothetical protein